MKLVCPTILSRTYLCNNNSNRSKNNEKCCTTLRECVCRQSAVKHETSTTFNFIGHIFTVFQVVYFFITEYNIRKIVEILLGLSHMMFA